MGHVLEGTFYGSRGNLREGDLQGHAKCYDRQGSAINKYIFFYSALPRFQAPGEGGRGEGEKEPGTQAKLCYLVNSTCCP